MDTLSRHLICDCYDCDTIILSDPSKVERLFRKAAAKAGATVVDFIFHLFRPQGLTAIAILQESHLSILAWPECGFAAIDFFTCGDCRPEEGLTVLREGLRVGRMQTVRLARGRSLEKQSVCTIDHVGDWLPGSERDLQSERWFDEEQHGMRFGVKVREHLYSSRSQFQQIDLFDTESMGRALVLDGLFQLTERDEHIYHEMLVHPAMVTAASIKRVLIIGGGDGGTAREVLRYPEVEKVTMVEIDREVVNVCKKFLPALGHWDDPRLEVLIEDGVRYVEHADDAAFDVMLVDCSDPVGPSTGLFSEEFLRQAVRVLSSEGVFVTQSESAFRHEQSFLEVQRRLRSVFPIVEPFFQAVPCYGVGLWSFSFASKSIRTDMVRPDRLETIELVTRHYSRRVHHAARTSDMRLEQVLDSLAKSIPRLG
jgi:spermidine synthase